MSAKSAPSKFDVRGNTKTKATGEPKSVHLNEDSKMAVLKIDPKIIGNITCVQINLCHGKATFDVLSRRFRIVNYT